jgi:hypothetical protein
LERRVDRVKLDWASNAAAADPRVCPELPEDKSPDHGWSSLGKVAGNVSASAATAADDSEIRASG